jgi:hypothetical protein
VKPTEVELSAALAALHLEAIRSGMALGELDGVDPSELKQRYRELVAALDARERLVFVAERGDEMVGMRSSSSAVPPTPTIGPRYSASRWPRKPAEPASAERSWTPSRQRRVNGR